MGDLIERQAAIEVVNNTDNLDEKAKGGIAMCVMGLPSAQPERKKGKWIGQKGGGCCCSECGRYALDEAEGNLIHISVKSNFCPNCGADMRGDEE